MDFQMTKPIDALKTIARYVAAKKPRTLAEAEHMLDVISVTADETILDEDAAESSLEKGLISKPFFHRSSHGNRPSLGSQLLTRDGRGGSRRISQSYPRFVASATAARRYSDAAC
jgi:hypothetical protein